MTQHGPIWMPIHGTPGIDVSSLQGAIDPALVAASGVAFVIARAEVRDEPDSRFLANYQGLRKASVLVGSYGVLEPYADPIVQADAFLEPVLDAGLERGDLMPSLDVELKGNRTGPELAEMLRKFAARVRQRSGRIPLLYSAKWFLDQLGDFAKLAPDLCALPLWVADYRCKPAPLLPSGWSNYALWQHGGDHSGAVPGIGGAGDNVDHNVFQGNLDELRAFIDRSYEAPPERAPNRYTVAEAQSLLTWAGFPCGRWGADGHFGPATVTALRAFQQAHGALVTGRLDWATRRALEDVERAQLADGGRGGAGAIPVPGAVPDPYPMRSSELARWGYGQPESTSE